MKKIAFFGTGLLGSPMAHRLLEAKYEVVVYNRTSGKTLSLKKSGAEVVLKPEEAFKKAQVFITMLSDYNAIDDVIFQESSPNFQDKTWIQMSTISPVESLLLKQQFEEAGGEYMEAPVLGSIVQAKNRTLVVLYGGLVAQFTSGG